MVVGAEGIGTGTTEFIPLYITMLKQQLRSIKPALQPGDQVHKTVSYAYSLTKADGMRRPVSGRDAVRSQVIEVLKAQIKGDRQ